MAKRTRKGKHALFMSHNTADKPFVRRLAHRLEKAGVKVWIDEAELKIGDCLLTKLSEAIQDTPFVGAVISRNSIDSRWVQKELQLAMAKEIESERVVVLPILIDEVKLPPFLSDKLYADFKSIHVFNESFLRLLATLGVEMPSDYRQRLEEDLEYAQWAEMTDPRTRPIRTRSLTLLEPHYNRVLVFWHEEGLTKIDTSIHVRYDHIRVDGQPAPGIIVVAVLWAFNNYDSLKSADTGVYYYIPKLQTPREAAIVEKLLSRIEEIIGVSPGTFKIKMLYEEGNAGRSLAAIAWVLRRRLLGTNVGRWDYLGSLIEMWKDDPKGSVSRSAIHRHGLAEHDRLSDVTMR